MVPPQFTDISRYQPHKVLSYFCTITGAGVRIKLLPVGFIDELQDVFTMRRLCTSTNRTLSENFVIPTRSFQRFFCIHITIAQFSEITTSIKK